MKSWHEPESINAKNRRKRIYEDRAYNCTRPLGRFEDSVRYHYRCKCGWCKQGRIVQQKKSDIGYREQRRDLDV